MVRGTKVKAKTTGRKGTVISISMPKKLATAMRQKSFTTGIPYAIVVQRFITYWLNGGQIPEPPTGQESDK